MNYFKLRRYKKYLKELRSLEIVIQDGFSKPQVYNFYELLFYTEYCCSAVLINNKIITFYVRVKDDKKN